MPELLESDFNLDHSNRSAETALVGALAIDG